MEPQLSAQQDPTPPLTPVIDQPSPSANLLRNPMVWLGLGAVIIIFLGGLFLFSKEPQKTTTTSSQTSQESPVAPTGTIEIQEQKDADAIQVGDLDSDFTEIDQQVNQL